MSGSKQGELSLGQTLSDVPMKEEEKLIKNEIMRLVKQLRMVAERRKSCGVLTRQQMQALEKERESLTAEHQEVLLMLSQITSPGNIKGNNRARRELCWLLQLENKYTSVIGEMRALIRESDNQILELEKKIVKQYQKAVKAKQAKNSKKLQKQLETLEKHLYNVTVCFDSNMTRNKKLREEIQDLQIQKAVFEDLRFKVHKELDQLRSRMNTIMNQATQTYQQQMEDQKMSDKIEMELKRIVSYNIEKKEQERILDWKARLDTFMFTKSISRSGLEEEARKKRALKAAQRAKRSQGQRFESYQRAYENLLEMAKDRDVDRLINEAVKREEENFASFNCIMELNSELEKIDQRIKDLQSEITALVVDQERAESGSLHVQKELEEKLNKTTEEANCYQEQCKELSKDLGLQTSGVEALSKEINQGTMKIMEQLGENEQSMDLKLLFGLMEQKIDEFPLGKFVQPHTSEDGSDPAQTIVSPLLEDTELLQEVDLEQLHPLAPTLDTTIDILSSVEVPLDHSQLRQLVLQSREESRGNAMDMDKP